MRIAFVGKGGSGKTTLAALMARHLARAGKSVLAVDADINQHLGQALGLTSQEAAGIPSLGNDAAVLKEYVRGTNPRIANAGEVFKTTPPGKGSRFVRLEEGDPVLDYFCKRAYGVRIAAVGAFTEEDLGVKCYHSKTGAVELLLNHLADTRRDYVLVDMTAGSDSFASGLFTRFDLTLIVVEPTQKSLDVYAQYRQYAKEFGICIKAVGNKITDEGDHTFLTESLGDDLVALVPSSRIVRRAEQGEGFAVNDVEKGVRAALARITQTIDKTPRDATRLYEQAVLFHRKNAESWANAAIGTDLREQIDPDFDLEAVVGK